MRPALAARITGAVYLAYFVAALAGQAGFSLGLLSTVLYLVLVGLFYRLFAPVDRTAATLALIFGTVGCALVAIGDGFLLAGESPRLNSAANHVALVFFGTFQLFLGYLIYRSTFVPRVIGILIALAGVGWLTYLAPDVPRPVSVPVVVLGAGAELVLMLWLLVAGDRRAMRSVAAAQE